MDPRACHSTAEESFLPRESNLRPWLLAYGVASQEPASTVCVTDKHQRRPGQLIHYRQWLLTSGPHSPTPPPPRSGDSLHKTCPLEGNRCFRTLAVFLHSSINDVSSDTLHVQQPRKSCHCTNMCNNSRLWSSGLTT